MSDDLLTLDGLALRRRVAGVLAGYSSSTLASMPDDALRLDYLVASWRLDSSLVPDGYVLGHAHGHSDAGDLEIRTSLIEQLLTGAIAHVESDWRARLDESVERANAVAKARFVELVRDAVETRVVDDDELLAVVVESDESLRSLLRERLGAHGETDVLDMNDARTAILADDALALAVRATARASAGAYALVLERDEAFARQANDESRALAVDVMTTYERDRARARDEIRAMVDEIRARTPDGEPGNRSVLLDLQVETLDDERRRWTTFRVYRWSTYRELESAGATVVASMREKLDELVATTSFAGVLRLAYAS